MNTVVVAAAVIERDGAFLVTKRLDGTHLGGAWEFPGGKCEPGEPLDACLWREIREELGVRCAVGEEMLAVSHDYADRRIELHFFECALLGEPEPQLGQEMQWVPRARLRDLEFPPADEALIARLSGNPGTT
ncbi:MAG TPA: (deoxy)nucleoside triphosphate pyrophosphohydrolase [Vicinamibacterales bacterium]|nr:(deoxy)nucleoside triphosphate pyrophosphohydrolase [Vicinamibacterales bacterium]